MQTTNVVLLAVAGILGLAVHISAARVAQLIARSFAWLFRRPEPQPWQRQAPQSPKVFPGVRASVGTMAVGEASRLDGRQSASATLGSR
jgi:hypothetical protein